MYGFDKYDVRQSAYNDYASFMVTREAANRLGSPSSQISILRDKYLFYIIMSRIRMPVPKVSGVIIHGRVFDIDLNPVDDSFLKNRIDYFVKDLDGECTSFVKHIKDFDQFDQIRKSGALN